jgi:hypothetical protein
MRDFAREAKRSSRSRIGESVPSYSGGSANHERPEFSGFPWNYTTGVIPLTSTTRPEAPTMDERNTLRVMIGRHKIGIVPMRIVD